MTTRNFAAAGIGYVPDYVGGIVYNRTGATLAAGELVMVDMLAGDAGFGGNASAAVYLAQSIGSDTHPLAQVITPTTAGIGALSGAAGVVFGVVDDVMSGGGADDTQVHVCWKGLVKVKMKSTAASGEYGKPILGENAVRTVTTTVTVAVKQLGRILADATTANATALCLFNGVEGFGNEAAS